MEFRASRSQVIGRRRRSVRLACLSAALLVVLAGCGSAKKPVAETPVAGGTFTDLATFATGSPAHIDPALATDAKTSQIALLIYQGLTTTGANGGITLGVALTYAPNADSSVWTFTLRKDAKFDNGAVVLPSDFKFAWQRALSPALTATPNANLKLIAGGDAVAAGQTGDLTGVVADDAAGTLVVTLTRPVFDFAAIVATAPFSPLPAAAFVDPATVGLAPNVAYSFWETALMIGNGPFKMATAWVPGQTVPIVRSATYSGGSTNRPPYLDGVNFVISPDPQAAFAKFGQPNGGNLAKIVPGQYDDLGKNAGVTITDPLLSTEYWGFNLADPTVGGDDNLPFRQAVTMAINRKQVNLEMYKGSSQPAEGWSPPSTPGYQLQPVSADRNVPAAKDALQEWGKTPPVLKLSFPKSESLTTEANILKKNLAEAGITANLNPIEPAAYAGQVESGAVQMFWGLAVASYVSQDAMIAPWFLSSSPPSLNPSRFSNADFDTGIATARATADNAARSQSYRSAENLMLERQPVIPMMWSSSGLVGSAAVRNLHVDPLDSIHYTDVWLKH